MFDILSDDELFKAAGLDDLFLDYRSIAKAEQKNTLKQVIEWIKDHSEWLNEELPREQWIYEPTNDTFKRVGIKINLEDWAELKKEAE